MQLNSQNYETPPSWLDSSVGRALHRHRRGHIGFDSHSSLHFVQDFFSQLLKVALYLHIGRLFSIQIFDHSAAFDCRDILDAEKGMLEVYQKHTFIEIVTNLRKFSAIFSNVVLLGKWKLVFPSYYSEQVLEPQDFRDQDLKKKPLHTTFIANGDLNCYQNIMHHAFGPTKRIKATKNRTCQNKGKPCLVTFESEPQRLAMVLSTLFGDGRARPTGNNYQWQLRCFPGLIQNCPKWPEWVEDHTVIGTQNTQRRSSDFIQSHGSLMCIASHVIKIIFSKTAISGRRTTCT